MAKRKARKGPPFSQLIAVAAASISVLFLLAFGSQIIEIYRLRSSLAVADEGLEDLRAEQAALEATLAYVQTDDYAEQVARAELNKVHPGDQRVVVITRQAPVPAPAQTPVPGAANEGSSHMDAWLELLFGN